MTHRVAVLVLHGAAAFDLGTPAQLLGAARTAGQRHYEVRTATADGGPVRTSGGFTIIPDHGPEIVDWAQTVIIPGIHGDLMGSPDGPILTEAELAALHRIPATTRLVSICTGAFAVALTGRLDGRPATTHWAHADRFRARFPLVELNPEVLFVDDGDVLTSAGVGAGVDLCLHLIRRDFGSDVANAAARRCVLPPWREGGQAQFIVRTVPSPTQTSTGPAREWAMNRLDQPISLDDLARQSRMSVRTFTRRFRDETGLSPAQWLTRQRVEHARALLESTDLPVDEVSRRAGFGTAVSLRQHLHSAVGVSPLAYRRTFRPTPA